MTSVDHTLFRPLNAAAGVPLRVAAYMRISDAIHAGVLPRSSLLPSEAELVTGLGVSRTVIREALILLEEDGLIRSRRGIGRFVCQELPRSGFEKIAPLEKTIAAQGPVTVLRTVQSLQGETSSFPGDFLELEPHGRSWFVETVLSAAGQPVALNQEHLPAPEQLTGSLEPLARVLAEAGEDQTLLGAACAAGLRFTGGQTDVTVGTPGPTRAALLGMEPDEPVLILTRRMLLADRPAMVSKTLINTHETTVSIRHAAL